MRRRKAIKGLGPGDVLLGIAHSHAGALTEPHDTPFGQFDPEVAGAFRTMLLARYSANRAADGPMGGAMYSEVMAQREPGPEEATLAIVISAAVGQAAAELREPRLASQVALEGVLAALRFQDYSARMKEARPDESES